MTDYKPDPTKQATASEAAYVHIVFLLDRSGSMSSIREDVIGGWNSFLEKQKALKTKATITQVQFDTGNPYEQILNFVPLQEAIPLSLENFQPRGGTPLLDAMGECITNTALDISAMPTHERPDGVTFVCMTDGQENSSHRYSRKQVRELMERLEKGTWEFVFLSADMGAVEEAADMGFAHARTMMFAPSTRGLSNSFESVSHMVLQKRGYNSDQMTIHHEFRDEDLRAAMEQDADASETAGPDQV